MAQRIAGTTMRRAARGLALAVLALGLRGYGTAHEATPRSQSLKVDNAVEVSVDKITVRQRQKMSKEFLDLVWTRLDANNDGKVTDKEKKDAAAKIGAFYTDNTAVRVNWGLLGIGSLTVVVENLPAKKPADTAKASPATAVFTVTYPYTSTPLDLVELVIPQVNAHEVNCEFKIQAPLNALRANAGTVTDFAAADMKQVDGHPDSFSVIVTKRGN